MANNHWECQVCGHQNNINHGLKIYCENCGNNRYGKIDSPIALLDLKKITLKDVGAKINEIIAYLH